jgi:hydroxyacylglutathione hydrolase
MIQIKHILIPLTLGIGTVNCYLLKEKSGFLLIDSGSSNARKYLLDELTSAGCTPGALKLILLTHGDFDHSGNAAHLQREYAVPVAMHAGDAGMVLRGDMFVNRKQPNWLARKIMPLAAGFGKKERFTPDILVQDGFNLSNFGIKAKVLSIPGHSTGSIGILTHEGDLFCGDLFENQDKPQLNTIMDDPTSAEASLTRLRSLNIRTVYPGHGDDFEMKSLKSDALQNDPQGDSTSDGH